MFAGVSPSLLFMPLPCHGILFVVHEPSLLISSSTQDGPELHLIIDNWHLRQHDQLQNKCDHQAVVCTRSNVYTNPAVVSDGQLLLSPYHSHSCSSCPCNMCKRAILQDYQQQSQQQYDRVLYIGDGSNDLCPTQALRPVDIVFVRAGYALDKLLQETAVERSVAAEIVRWNTGHDIVQRLKQL